MNFYICEMNILVDLMYEIVHEVTIFLSEPKKTHLTLSSIPPFIVTFTTLVEYRCSFISRTDLFCDGKYIVAPIRIKRTTRFQMFLVAFQVTLTILPFPSMN